MKQVVVHPERCVGCMQCMLACATAHSHSLTLFAASQETPQPKPRIHVGAGRFNEGFPNRCRHCDPAPCQMACLAGAIYRVTAQAPYHQSGPLHQLCLVCHGLPLWGDPLS
jgi:carbon-monoxide dehydrogenase iron sulfur subunit